MGGMLQLV